MAAATTMVSSAGGLLAMLNESHPALKLHALSNLNSFVDYFWPEISTSVPIIESLYEDEEFDQRQLAALLVSKENSMTRYPMPWELALYLMCQKIRTMFILFLPKQSMNMLVSRLRQLRQRMNPRRLTLDWRRLLRECLITDGKNQQAIGMALECRRLDKLEEAVIKSDNIHATINYCIDVSHSFVNRREYRREVLRLLVKVYQQLPSPDYLSICQRLMFLDEREVVASILEKPLRSEVEDDALLAFQIAFDLVENEHQAFLLSVRDRLPSPKPQLLATAQSGSCQPDSAQSGSVVPLQDVQMTDGTEESSNSLNLDQRDGVYVERLAKIRGILSGETSIQLTLQFLYSHNKSDLLILKSIKQSVEVRNSVCHSATIYANAIMHAGTTVDTFLRENLDWLSRATNWAKFSATAGLGVIHRGHLEQGRSLMAPYLPQGGSGGGSPYSEGGALYALGLIHANHGEGIKQFLRDSLGSTNVEVIQHGACLGLGLAALGTADDDIFEDIKNVLYIQIVMLPVKLRALVWVY